MAKFTSVIFDQDSANFANKLGIQETDNNDQLVAVYDLDGDQLAYPGGPNASWTAQHELESDEFWQAVVEIEEKYLVTKDA